MSDLNRALGPNASLPPNGLAEAEDTSATNLAACDVVLDNFSIGSLALDGQQVARLFEL